MHPALIAALQASSRRLYEAVRVSMMPCQCLICFVRFMRRTRYPSAGPASTKKDHPAKINLTKKLASGPAFTRRKPRSPVKFFALYDTNKVYAFSGQSSRSGGWCGCQPTPTMTPTQIANLEADYLQRSRQAKACGDYVTAAAWSNAASLLIEAASKPARRKSRRPLDLGKVAG